MSKSPAELLIEKVKKKHKTPDAIAFLSRAFEQNKDPTYLHACAILMSELQEDAEGFNGVYWSLKSRIFTLDSDQNADKIKKLNFTKLAPAFFRYVDKVKQRISRPDVSMPDPEAPIGRVLILLAQYLGAPHSPSLVALAFAQRLKLQGDIDVQILDTQVMPGSVSGRYHNQSVFRTYSRKDEAENGVCYTEYKDIVVPVRFAEPQGISDDKLETTLKSIAEYDPDVIISVGDSNIITELCDDLWPCMLWPTIHTEQFSAVDLQFRQTDTPPDVNIPWKRLKRQQPETHKNTFSLDTIAEKNAEITREDLKFNETDFVFTIVGTRLARELSESFQTELVRLLDADARAKILFVGSPSLQLIPQLVRKRDRLTIIGYTDKLREIISQADVFLNPPRQGGGQGSYLAMLEKVAIATLKDCDVALAMKEGGAVDTVEALIDLAIDMMKNPEVKEDYVARSQRQLEKARQINTPEESHARLVKWCERARLNFVERHGQ